MSNLATVIAIVPRLPPAIDGVGDYALNLARQLRKDFNIHTHFIVGNYTWQGAAEIEGFTISQITDNSANILVNLLSSYHCSSPVLLHYVGYGYAQRGCPIWLVDGLQRWKSLHPKSNLVTMFHEISASGPPWTSAFWLSSLQRDLAARLTKLSDRCITSKQLYADIITEISKGKHNQVLFLPVFSTVGEPDQLPPDLSERQQRLVIFGGVANRARVYNQSQRVLDYVCQRLNIQEICDIGTPTGITPSFIGKVPILEIGEQPVHKVSDILTNSIAGFSDYNPDFLAKSTIFAAYCAYRLLPINAKGSLSLIDEIEGGKHYWVPDINRNDLGGQFNWQTIADNSFDWYQKHNLSRQSSIFASYLLHGDLNSAITQLKIFLVKEIMQLESVSQCPACNSLESAYFIENRHDYVCGLSGTWSFRKCHQCKSLWIDPRPIKEMIPFLYPENYTFTHGQPANPLKEPDGFLQRLLFAIKLGTLDQLFGYKGISSKASLSWGVALGKIISYFPRISKRVGYTVRYLSCIPSGNLLEVGVGNGSFLWLMSALGWQVTGIEPDPEAAKAATATGLTIIPCDIESAELQDSYYDAIVLHHVLEHLPNPRIALSKLVKSLKSGGTLVSISPNPAGLIADLFGQNWYQLDPPRHLVLPTSQGYKSLLEEELVELNISTTMQTSFWIFKESLSLKYTGKTGTYQGWLLPKIFSWISSFFLSVKPNSGEEVICVAVKK